MTVRTRVTASATVAVLLVLVVTALVLVAQQRRILTESLQEGLEERADELAELASEVRTPIRGLGEDDTLAQLVVDGRVVATSENAIGLRPVAAAPGPDREVVRTEGELPHEEGRFRVVSVGFELDGQPAAVHVAGTLDDIDESVATLQRSLLVAVPLVVLALAALLWGLVGRTLRPVEDIRSEVASIGGTELHRRVPVPAGDDEVARLATTMNQMLERVEAATTRQQRFVADASHELRSPLTRVRTELEVDLAHPDTADLRATHRSVLEETIGLQRLAEDLLLLARADAGALADGAQVVDLADVVATVAQRAIDDGAVLDVTAVAPARVEADRDQLARLVANLVENARRHATTEVAITVAEVGAQVELAVADDGPGVPEADRDRIFERFPRVDGARATAEGGAGLGLAIAREIAERHGGTLHLEPSAVGARFVLRLPVAR